MASERVVAWVARQEPGLVDAIWAVFHRRASSTQHEQVAAWIERRVRNVGEEQILCPTEGCTRPARHRGMHSGPNSQSKGRAAKKRASPTPDPEFSYHSGTPHPRVLARFYVPVPVEALAGFGEGVQVRATREAIEVVGEVP